MEQFITLQLHNDQSGELITVGNNGVNARLYFETKPNSAFVLTPHVEALKASIKDFCNKAPKIMESLSEKGWKDRAWKELDRVATAFQKLRIATIERRNAIDERRLELLRPLKPLEPLRAYEIRQWAREMKPSEVVPFALKDAEIASAILDSKILARMNNDFIIHIENALIKMNLVNRYSTYAQLKPTADDVLADGADFAEINRLADKAIENFEFALAELDIVASTLNGTVHFCAIAAIVSRADAFEILMSKHAS